MNRRLALFCMIFCAFETFGATDFDSWKSDFYKTAQRQKISKEVLDKYFMKAVFLPEVIESDRKQPEFSLSLGNYMQRVVSDGRIEKGRQLMKKHQKLLKEIEIKYGVPAHYLVAFWGAETNFGETKGQIDVLNAVATLSFDERRSEFFSEQLMTLLKILQKEKIAVPTGSWAGAFGHSNLCQPPFINMRWTKMVTGNAMF